MNNDLLLTVENLKTYFFSREGTLRAVDGVSFSLRKGHTLGIVGESGCGKSVTAQSILRIVPANGRIVEGKILLTVGENEIDIAQLDPEGDQMHSIQGKEIAMIFQEPMTSFSPVYTIGNQITEVIRLHQNASSRESLDIALDMLNKVGMPKPEEIVDSYPFNLSGGMRQRAMIAMALSCKPNLLIADEPTTAVDVTIQAQVLELISELQKDLGMALILITHDLGIIAELAEQVLIMYLGKNVEQAGVVDIYYDPKHPYTQGLLASIPKLGLGGDQQLDPIEGSVPSLYELPQGCKFHTRCPHFMAGKCDRNEPPFVEIKPGQHASCYLYVEGN